MDDEFKRFEEEVLSRFTLQREKESDYYLLEYKPNGRTAKFKFSDDYVCKFKIDKNWVLDLYMDPTLLNQLEVKDPEERADLLTPFWECDPSRDPGFKPL